jgi:hypothetical protein
MHSIFFINFLKLFQVLSVNISVGLVLASIRGVGSATSIQRESMDEVDFAVIHFLEKKKLLLGRLTYVK